jgi:hypothetical protein
MEENGNRAIETGMAKSVGVISQFIKIFWFMIEY